ncbi:myrosinase 1-like isoform X1 [Neodiprion virginianus]|uniref:myrosinase 1-like isoform X1 n=2 Tax=Neodiprion virginianus TaxID=2961670 RepID=UPI001EE6B3B7|nr:myrosinase 1-like isoform X1 [Neodiprion virginianus]
MKKSIIFVFLVLTHRLSTQDDEDVYLKFPTGLKIGVGGAAYQIEGAWNISNKGESVWDNFVHNRPWKIKDQSNGDTASNSYHKYKDDVKMVKRLGLDYYRLSISWARVLPNGSADSINQEGIQYYQNLIDELVANGIEPIVTMYHWDHPQVLEDMGGWMNESMATWFAEYAEVLYRELGPKVKTFLTINEPQILCFQGYGSGIIAPGRDLGTAGTYTCGHNMLKAHAKAYRLYDEKYRSIQNGKLGIVSHCDGYLPETEGETLPLELAYQFRCGWISHPIFVGDYHQVMKSRVAQLSRDEGLSESRLPQFSPEWIRYIKGTADFFGLNHYTSFLVGFPTTTKQNGSFVLHDSGLLVRSDPRWEAGSLKWIHIIPEGFSSLLRKIKSEYNNPPVYITENGFSDNNKVQDYQRIKYHYLYLKELLQAVKRDGCNVQRYTFWSLLDNFEWSSGYQHTFGLINVNMTSPGRERTPKLSFTWLQNVMRMRQLQLPIPSPSVNTTTNHQ